MEQLIATIKRFTSLSPELELKINHSFFYEKKTCSTLLLGKGQIAREKWFIIKGIAKAFFFDKDASEKVIGFHLPNSFMTQNESYILQKPSSIFIEAINDMELLYIKKKDEDELLCYPEYLKFAYHFNLNLQVQNQQIYNQILYQNGHERYLYLLKNYPLIIQSVKQKDIASFIGVSQERLSRIRKSIY